MFYHPRGVSPLVGAASHSPGTCPEGSWTNLVFVRPVSPALILSHSGSYVLRRYLILQERTPDKVLNTRNTSTTPFLFLGSMFLKRPEC